MKLPLLVSGTLALLLSLSLAGCKPSQKQAPASPTPKTASAPAANVTPTSPAARTSFQQVTEQLDPGGSLFGYVAVDRWLAGLATNVSQLRELAVQLPNQPFGDPEQVDRLFDLAIRFINLSGVQDVTGVGVSGVEIGPGLHRTKLVLHHPPGQGQGFLWSLFGRAPHPWRGLDLLPSDTALAFHSDLNAGELWQIVQRELAKSGIAAAAQWAERWPGEFEKHTKMPWAKLLDSLGGEVGVALTLDATNQTQLPIANIPMDLPAPGLLVTVKVNNDLLYDRLSAQLRPNPQARFTEARNLKMATLPLPTPPEWGLELTLASNGEYFFVASSSGVVRAALATRDGTRPGLKTTPEYQSLAAHTPAEGNQFIFVSRRFGETVGAIQNHVMNASQLPPGLAPMMQRMMMGAQPAMGLTVRTHTDSGWRTVAVGNQNPADSLLLAPAVAVTAVGAGMLLPALAKAKGKAQTVQSVNQLKQIALAARLYANDHNEQYPPADKWCDTLKDELGSVKVLKSPNDPSPEGCSYAYNSKLSGKRETDVPANTVMFFETRGGWNQHGGRELLLSSPRTSGLYAIAFADGSVQQVTPARIDSLRWEP